MLCGLLKCGYLDLEMLDKCDYDYDNIKDYLSFMKVEDLDLNMLLEGCIQYYKDRVQNIIDEEITETESNLKGLEDYEDTYNGNIAYEYTNKIIDLRQKLEELQSLDSASDIEYYTNYLDTSVYIVDEDTKEIYRKYLRDKIEKENAFSIIIITKQFNEETSFENVPKVRDKLKMLENVVKLL